MTDDWGAPVGAGWADALAPARAHLASTREFLAEETEQGRAWLPHPEQVMRAFELPLDDVRVVMVGQDPYPTPGDAVGLSFSVAPGHPMPRSLRNIATELAHDTGETLLDGDLSHWASQGVMLLNRVLTVREGDAGSHRRRGWEDVTSQALKALGARGGPLVAVLWGKDAQSAASFLGDVPVVASAHPSPLSARRGFFGSRPFSQVNALLQDQGAQPIAWGTLEPGT